jgi:beta-glucosidase
MVAAAHHLLLAHGWSVPVIRRNCPQAEVGITLNLSPHVPASSSAADRRAAWLKDGTLNRWFLDPLAARGYPEDIVQHYRQPMGFVEAGDLDAIAVPIDFLGVNYYARTVVRSTAIPEEENAPREVLLNPNPTEMGWEVHPPGLYDLLLRLHADYRFPAIYITENGAAYPDRLASDGQVQDPRRIAYLHDHLIWARRAIAAGVPLRGFFVWSLLDNFEWAYGYSKRFGLYYVDFETLKRLPKASAHWYRRVIAANGVVD